MLTKLKFKNYKSFTHETIVELSSTNFKTNIKGCCFYGENASGKTNILEVIKLLLDMLFNEHNNFFTLVTFFNEVQTMFFEYTFLIDEKEIVYYFEIDRNGIINKETLTINNEIKLYRLISSCKSKITEKENYDINDANKNILFLRSIYFNIGFNRYKELLHLFDFLEHSIFINPINEIQEEYLKQTYLQKYIDKYGVDDINNFLKKFNFLYQINYEKNEFINSIFSFTTQLKFIRSNFYDIHYFMESFGNKILINILPCILTIVRTGGILIIDEFSSVLSKKTQKILIDYIFSNSLNCQLFFSSNSIILPKNKCIKIEEVYFNKKGSFIKTID